MAGVSTKEIRTRIRSMESTKQITKAMEMVASSKLRHAQNRIGSSRPYFEILQKTVADIIRANAELSSPYLTRQPGNRCTCVVIAGDRGLAGGYNSNVLKLALTQGQEQQTHLVPVGKKAVDFFTARNYPVLTAGYGDAEDMAIGDCFSLARQLCKSYLAGEAQEIRLVYTRFDSVLSQTPAVLQLLPLVPAEDDREELDILYEPDSQTVFEAIVPEYLGGVIYGALCESRAAEQAARRTAMDSATQNAEDMIADLSLKFNQARQAAITQEITEIVAGSQA